MKKLLTSLAIASTLISPVAVEANEFAPEKSIKKAEISTAVAKSAKPEVMPPNGWNINDLMAKTGNNQSDDAESAVAGFFFLVVVLVVIVFGIALYMLPTIVAVTTGSSLVAPVAIINLLLGFTFIGWVAALAMAVLPKQKNQNIIVQQSNDGKSNSATPSGVEKITY